MRHTVAWLMAFVLTFIAANQSAASDTPAYLAISNLTDSSFVVSWLTGDAEMGQVQIVDGGCYNDVRGGDFIGKTHYVIVTGLQATSRYSFDIASGETRYDNTGAHWVINTGEPLPPRAPDVVFGQARDPNGSNVTDAIVLVTIDRVQQGAPSAVLSTLITEKDSGIFSINLAETRTLWDPTRYFDYSINSDRYMNNSVTLEAMAPQGIGLVTLDTGDARLRAGGSGDMVDIPLITAAEH